MAAPVTIIESGRERAIEGPMTGRSAIDAFRSLWRSRSLLHALVLRDLNLRYRGSVLGLAWLVLAPAVMAVAYTYLFGFLFKSRFSGGGISQTWLGIYIGTTLYNLFSEPLGRSSSLIQDQASFVKKIAMPLRILPAVPVLTAFVSGLISFAMLLVFQLALDGLPPPAVLIFPFVILPYAMAIQGLCWTVSACSAYVRDLRQVVMFATTFLLFVTPVFYPTNLIPQPLRTLALLNPIAFAIMSIRRSFLEGVVPNPFLYAAFLLISFMLFMGGYALYRRLQGGFADVV